MSSLTRNDAPWTRCELITEPNLDSVAVLDDDIKFIRLVERILRDEHLDVQPVTTLDLDEAVRVVEQSGCRAALIDVYMYGDCAGFALVEKLRANPATANLPLIVTSAAHREVGRKVGFLVKNNCSVLLKPFDVDDLVAKVRAARCPRPLIYQIGAPAGGAG
jgi:two-component system, OmpR family, alkaline phosphatase synthesis response regulator PhoP